MTTRNDITGDKIQSRQDNAEAYAQGWDEDYHHVDVQLWLNDLWKKKDQLNLEYHKLLKKLMKLENVQ